MSSSIVQTGGTVAVRVDARGIASTAVSLDGDLIITYTDGEQQNAGRVVPDGVGTGTVRSVSVSGANGIAATVSNPNTTPTIALALGAITPASIAAIGAVTGSNLSGTNTGDQTNVPGNAGTATRLATGRTINGVLFDGTSNIAITAVWAAARTLSLTGDATASLSVDGSANVSAPITLATVNANTGTFGGSTAVPVITVDGKGRITAVTTAAISGGGGGGDMFKADNLSGLANYQTARTNLGATSVGNAVFTAASAGDGRSALGAAASGANTDITSITGSAATLTTGRTISLTGDVSYTSGSFNGSGNVTGAATLATVNSNTGTFGSSTQVPVITVDAKGRVTAVSTAAVSGGGGGTDISTFPVLIASRNTAFQVNRDQFVTIPLDIITVDTVNGFNGQTWTVPSGQAGLYQIQSKVRYNDDAPAGISYGQGTGISNGDGPSFLWTTTITAANAQRNGLYNSRTMMLTAGDQVRLFSYNEFSGGRGLTAELIVTRIR